jgi:hypothetical protein
METLSFYAQAVTQKKLIWNFGWVQNRWDPKNNASRGEPQSM